MSYQTLRDIVAARPGTLAFLGFLAALNLALFIYLSGWQRPELQRAQGEWFAKREALASREEGLPGIEQYRKGVHDLALLQSRMIPKKEFPVFLGRIFASGSRERLAIKQVSYKPAPVKDEPGLVAYGISFTVSGRYPAIKNFIADLERYPEMVTLDSITLSSRSATQEAVELKMQLTAYLTTEGR